MYAGQQLVLRKKSSLNQTEKKNKSDMLLGKEIPNVEEIKGFCSQ